MYWDGEDAGVSFLFHVNMTPAFPCYNPSCTFKRFNNPLRFKTVKSAHEAFFAFRVFPSFSITSRCPSMASLIISRASSIVSP